MKALAFAAVGLSMFVSSAAVMADNARPVKFAVTVMSDHNPKAWNWQTGQSDATVATGLSGWTCKTKPVTTWTQAAAFGNPAAVWQGAHLECTSASGTVTIGVGCRLTSDHQFNSSLLTISDTAGHNIDLTVSCEN